MAAKSDRRIRVHGFGELEAALMELLWDRAEPTSVREALTELSWHRTLAYTTVMTVLDTLFRKGWLTREPDGRAYRYTPAVSRDQYVAQAMHDALVDSGNRAEALTQFVGRMTLDDAAALRAALNSYERRISGR
ncbi:BlaI/MecI/CopY family transcriptional regulator [Dactylosporangium sucinum]|uniref:Penicillinase repressor n=1 Tax=Dactylosporangium sucinum TaxID=1424081 RepID=A0A917U8Y5_9ACTN|nr:BlaI/MecI/CopY family transcriptional regulator [Dactylosporangium sucinum]GGM67116.1 penicillinase repressor [Dactylosporangium sucinum]